MKILAGIMLLGAMVCTSTAFAYPTLYGASGVAVLPTARTIVPGMYAIGVDGNDLANSTEIPVRVLYGMGDNLEVGAAYLPGETDRFGLNAKLRVEGLVSGATTAIGVQYLRPIDGSDAAALQPYLAITRTRASNDKIFPLISITVGTSITQLRPNSSFYLREYGSLEAYARNGMVIGLEYQGSNSGLAGDDQPLASAVIRFPLSDKFAAQVGVTNADGFVGTDKARVFLGVCFVGGKAIPKDEANIRTMQPYRTLTAVWTKGDDVISIPISRKPYGDPVPGDWGAPRR